MRDQESRPANPALVSLNHRKTRTKVKSKHPSIAALAAMMLGLLGSIPSNLHAGINIEDLDDLHYWGTGSNRAALVVDWNDGKTNNTFAWGFRWVGAAPTFADMITSLAKANSGLFLRLDSDGNFGMALYGVGYQTSSAPFGVTGALDPAGINVTPVFTDGVNDMNVINGATDAPSSSSSAAALNAGDHYSEAWNTPTRYWTLYLSGTSTFPSAATPSFSYPSWSEAGAGASSVTLDDNGWYALSYSDLSWTAVVPGSAVAAVPEPGGIALIVWGSGFLSMNIRRRRTTA